MTLLQVQNGGKHFGTKTLFDRASFAVNEGEHVGVIGPNGAGKTTLFKVLVGQEHLDEGELTRSQALRIGYLEQESEWPVEIQAEEHLRRNCSKAIWELKRLGRDLGLTETHFASSLRSLSGGFRMRMKLLYLIGQEPNLMLLDEPTNFLDLESVLALETFLQSYSGAFLLISHDREFLKRTTEYTLEVEGGDIVKFPGHIDDYFEQKDQLRAVLQAQTSNQENKRRQILEFVSRFGAKATKARQAQSRLKRLEKMDRIEIRDLPVRARIRIPPPVHTGREVLRLQGCDLGYAANSPVLRGVRLRFERGDHIGVVGRNGTGKSTLLKSLAGTLPLLSGQRELGYQVRLSYFSQHTADQLDLNANVFESLQAAAHKEISRQDMLNMAGSLLFTGTDVEKTIRVLSGGEKARVALAQLLLAKSPLLLLDEPTNHLDFDTVEALTEALRDYAGTVVVVSHDRSFIGRVANRILEIGNGGVELYPGSYDEYVWSVQRGALSQRPDSGKEDASAPASPETGLKRNFKDASKALQSSIRENQRLIQRGEERLRELTKKRDRLNHELLALKGAPAAEAAKELGLCAREMEQIEADLLNQMELLELKERELAALRGEPP